MNVILRQFLVGLVTPGVMWKWGRFDFAPHVVVKQFVSGSLTDPRYDVSMKVFCAYASNSNVDRHLLWRHLIEITFG